MSPFQNRVRPILMLVTACLVGVPGCSRPPVKGEGNSGASTPGNGTGTGSGAGASNAAAIDGGSGNTGSGAGGGTDGGSGLGNGSTPGGNEVLDPGQMIDDSTPLATCQSVTIERAQVLPDPMTNNDVTAKIQMMSLNDKIAQMSGGPCSYASPTDCFDQDAVPGAGLPAWTMRDGPRGVRRLGGGPSTSFPVAMARAATFDLDLEKRIGAAMGEEMLAFKYDLLLAPVINLLRHPAWGRAQETYGEDPVLLGEMGAAFTNGVQGKGVPNCVKHFAANNSDDNRNFTSANMDEQTLRENYTRQFQTVVEKADPACIMAAYNKVNGTFSAENPHLLTDLARTEWKWNGIVLSDWGATKSTVASANAGLDLEMPDSAYFGGLAQAVQSGQVQGTTIDRAARRVLNIKYHFGHLDPAYASRPANESIVNDKSHQLLAREAAEKGMVLLKNDGILPLREGAVTSILIVGPDGNQARLGDDGSSDVDPPYAVTPLQGLKDRAMSAGIDVQHIADINAAVAAAAKFSVVILPVAMQHRDEGEGYNQGGDRNDLLLSGAHPVSWNPKPQEWINRLSAVNPNIILVMNFGSAVIMEPFIDKVKGLLYSFYPGQEGGNALARLLFGDVNFSGKLPFTVAVNAADYPVFGNGSGSVDYPYLHGYRMFEAEDKPVRFPFGFGLSYTTYEYGAPRLLCNAGVNLNGQLSVAVDVTNTGDVAGEEIVEFYVGYPNTAVRRPKKELKTFVRVALDSGKTKTVVLNVPAKDLAYYDEGKSAWVVEANEHDALVGSSSDPKDLQGVKFTVTP